MTENDTITCPAARPYGEELVCGMEYCFCKSNGKLDKEGSSDFHKCKRFNYILEEIALAML